MNDDWAVKCHISDRVQHREIRPGHDEKCEWNFHFKGYEECRCAVRAYERDPFPGAEREPETVDDEMENFLEHFFTTVRTFQEKMT